MLNTPRVWPVKRSANQTPSTPSTATNANRSIHFFAVPRMPVTARSSVMILSTKSSDTVDPIAVVHHGVH